MLDTYLPSSLVVGMVAVGCGGPPTTESTMARGGAPVTAASAGASGPSPSPPARASSTLNVVQNVEGTREASVPGLRKVDRAALIDDLTRVTDQAIGARKQPNDFAQLVGVRADSLVAKLGLENGDRLLWVDGHPLTDASTRALWTDAAAKPTFWLLIHRDGKTIKVLYSFE